MSKSKRRDINSIFGMFNESKDKIVYSVISFFKKKGENMQGGDGL